MRQIVEDFLLMESRQACPNFIVEVPAAVLSVLERAGGNQPLLPGLHCSLQSLLHLNTGRLREELC